MVGKEERASTTFLILWRFETGNILNVYSEQCTHCVIRKILIFIFQSNIGIQIEISVFLFPITAICMSSLFVKSFIYICSFLLSVSKWLSSILFPQIISSTYKPSHSMILHLLSVYPPSHFTFQLLTIIWPSLLCSAFP